MPFHIDFFDARITACTGTCSYRYRKQDGRLSFEEATVPIKKAWFKCQVWGHFEFNCIVINSLD